MRTCFISLLLVLCAALQGRAQDPPCRWLTVRDGLPSNNVYWSLQDREGLMWFGTDAGAARYDGVRFEVFNSSNGTADNEVLKLAEDDQGRIWFLTLNGELSFWYAGKIHNARTDQVLGRCRLSQGISGFVQHNDGGLWFGGYADELVRLAPDLSRCDRFDLGLIGSSPSQVSFAPGDGPSPIVVHGTLIHTVDKGKVVRLDSIARPAPAHHLGTLAGVGPVVANGTGLARLRDPDNALPWRTGTPDMTDLRWLSSDRQGVLWWSRGRRGVMSIAWEDDSLAIGAVILADERVTSLYEDKDGNRWIGTGTHGVAFIAPDQWTLQFHPTSTGKGPESVTSTFVTPAGQVLCGTDKGRLFSLVKGRFEPIAGTEAMHDKGRVLGITGSGERVWVCQDAAVFTFQWPSAAVRLSAVPLRSGAGLPQETGLKSIAIGPGGEIVGVFHAICDIRMDQGSWSGTYPDGVERSLARIYAPYFDASGDLWFDRGNHLHRIHDGTETEHPHLDSVLNVRITDIVGIDEPTLAIATSGSGVAIVRKGELVARLTAKEGLASDQCRQLAVRNGRLLVATDRGASIVPLPIGPGPMQNWNMDNGLPTNDVLSVDGDSANIYLGTADGLCVLPYSTPQSSGPPPELRFSMIAYGDTSFSPGATVDIPYGTKRVTITAFAPWFGDPGRLEHAFTTSDGEHWQPCSNGTVTLASWGSGHLRVRMKARKAGSDWSAPIALGLYIDPPWYLIGRVQVLAVLALVGGVILMAHARTRRRFARELQRLEKEHALAEERRRIAEDVHDDLGADLSHLLMMARLARGHHKATLGHDPLQQIEDISGRMVQKIDDIVWSLDPRSDTVNATLDHLHQQVEAHCERARISYRTSIGADPQRRMLSAQQRRDLQLTMKELLNNVLKHGHPQCIRLSSRISGDRLHIEMTHDMGPVTEPDPVRTGNGHGSENMRRRLARHGGTFSGPLHKEDVLVWTLELPLTNEHGPA